MPYIWHSSALAIVARDGGAREEYGVANVDLIDSNTSGPDNRPTPEASGFASATSDESGKASITLTVSMQPGNNYRAAASVIREAVETQIDQSDADALSVTGGDGAPVGRNGDFGGYRVPAVWSPMLTVWRKLHVELDSMSAESSVQGDREADIEWTRFITAPVSPSVPAPVQVDTPGIGLTTILGYLIPAGNPCQSAADNRWEGGAFIPNLGELEFLIVRNGCHLTSDGQLLTELVILGNPGDIAGVTVTVRDDDLVPPAGAPAQLPQTGVITTSIATAYRDAYVEIADATPEENPNTVVEWRSHLGVFDLTLDYETGTGVSSSWDIGSSSSFWARHVVMCYQAAQTVAGDPDPLENCAVSSNCNAYQAPYPLLGLPSVTGQSDVLGKTIRNEVIWDTALSTVYVETIRDQDIDATSTRPWQVIAHEIGHSTFHFNAIPGCCTSSGDHFELGLMTGEPEVASLQNIPAHQRFTVITLERFRSVERW